MADFELCLRLIVLCGKHSQAESVAGAERLPNDYAGDPNANKNLLRTKKGKNFLDLYTVCTSTDRDIICVRSVVLNTTTRCPVDPSTQEHREQLSNKLFIGFLCSGCSSLPFSRFLWGVRLVWRWNLAARYRYSVARLHLMG